MKRVVWFAASQLGFFAAVLSFNVYAGDVKQTASQYPICDFGEMQYSSESLFFELRNMSGHIKSVNFSGNNFGGDKPALFQVNESGKVTSVQIGDTKDSYTYDITGRLAFRTQASPDLVFHDEFSYPDSNTVIIKTSWSVGGENRWSFVVQTRSKNEKGEVCVGTKWVPGGLYTATRVTRERDGSYSSQNLNIDSFPQFQQRVGYADALKINNQAIDYLIALKGTPEECDEQTGFDAKYSCLFSTTAKDGDDLKTITKIKRVGDQSLFIKTVRWTDANGRVLESMWRNDKPLPNGKQPHHFYKYKVDEHGNWVERQEYTDVDNGGKIEAKLDGKPTIRHIEYYD